jgi:Potential Queuosine, Q, salvage protein family
VPDLLDELRDACHWVSARARDVSIERRRIAGYAADLRPPRARRSGAGRPHDPEAQAAFWLTLDAINFGSGWFPTLRKRPGLSGYNTIAAGLRERFEREGRWSAAQLAGIDATALAHALGQDPEHELMALFAHSLRDLGAHVEHEFGGRFVRAVSEGALGAAELVERLAGWDCFADFSRYEGRRIPFLKRAQIAVADLARAEVVEPPDLHRLTMFADNLVPHVLRLDGVLSFDPALVARIEREELLEPGAPEEVEIRACAVHAVELLVRSRPELTAAAVDEILWLRGGEPRYKARPRHRARGTAY